MTDAIKKTGKRKVDKVGPIASKRFKNAAIRKRGGKQPSVPIKTVSGLKDANKESQSKLNKEQVDLYDIILSHLLDEGYAETPEAAEAIMVNMSEDWRECIVEEDSIAAMAMTERAAKRRKQRYGDSDTSRWGDDYDFSNHRHWMSCQDFGKKKGRKKGSRRGIVIQLNHFPNWHTRGFHYLSFFV
jgi:hypothetical protein